MILAIDKDVVMLVILLAVLISNSSVLDLAVLAMPAAQVWNQ